jgi:hypothetical protein
MRATCILGFSPCVRLRSRPSGWRSCRFALHLCIPGKKGTTPCHHQTLLSSLHVSHDQFSAHTELVVAVNLATLLGRLNGLPGPGTGPSHQDANLAIDSWSALPAGMWRTDRSVLRASSGLDRRGGYSTDRRLSEAVPVNAAPDQDVCGVDM